MIGILSAAERRIGWWQALNPAIYLISLLPGLAVYVLLFPQAPVSLHLLWATLGVVLIQHGINLMNDVMDWGRGADVEKFSSWVRFHRLRPEVTRVHGVLALLLGTALGVGLLAVVGRLEILLLALPLVALGYGYNTGSRPFAYNAFSEWVTGICYGPGVFGCLWLLSGSSNWKAGVAGSLSFGLLAVAVLLSHQPSQVLTDAMVGKQSFAVRFGVPTTRRVTTYLFLISLLALDATFLLVNLTSVAILGMVSSVLIAGLAVAGARLNPRFILSSGLLKILLLGLAAYYVRAL